MTTPAPLVLALLAAPALGMAQAVADPSAAVPAPIYRSAFDTGPRGVVEDRLDWKDAHARVGEFPRGHGDIVRWEERQQSPQASPPGMPGGPATPGHRHGGHRP